MSDTHEQLLASLRASGTAEANGAFTLDVERAREKMRGWQLSEPHLYILKVVQHAVAAGARHLTVISGPGRTRAQHDGREPSDGELKGLQAHLLPDDAGHGSLSPLAVALNTALSLPDAEVNISSWSGKRGGVLRATGDGAAYHEIEAGWMHLDRGTTFEVLTQTSLFRLRYDTPECDLLKQRCPFVPLSLTLNSVEVSHGPFGEARDHGIFYPPSRLVLHANYPFPAMRSFPRNHHALEVRFWSQDEATGRIGLPLPSQATESMRATWSSPLPLREDRVRVPSDRGPARHIEACHGALSLCADSALDGEVALVIRGVLFAVLRFEELKGLRGVLAVDSHRSDLTGLALTEAAAQAVAGEVKANAQRLYDHMHERFKGSSLGDCIGHLLTGRAR